MLVYKNIQFPFHPTRPYFFSNFVTTIDGRTIVKDKPEYLPIGSETDFETFLDLRKYADALIHGKHTATLHRTVDTIAQKPFLQKRKKQDKDTILPYFIVTNHPDSTLLPALIKNPMEKPYIVTNTTVKIPKTIDNLAHIVRCGTKKVDLQKFSKYLFSQGYKHVLVEGGPTLMGSFLSENLIDELFITIAPKIFNGTQNEFLTMTEGRLIKPEKVNTWKLISIKAVDNEIYLRYKRDAESSSA